MQEHCDAVVSEDMVGDGASASGVDLGAQAVGGLGGQGSYCFGYCSSCLDVVVAVVEDAVAAAVVTYDSPSFEGRSQEGLRPSLGACLDVPEGASFPEEEHACAHTCLDASAFAVAAVGPSS